MSASPLEMEPNDSHASPPAPAEAVRHAQIRADPLFHWIFLGMSVGVLALSFLLTVRSDRYVIVPLLNQPLPELCMLKRQTGLGCPGCGLTRSFISIAHGQFERAWRYNPGGLLFFGIVVFQLAYRPYQLYRIKKGRSEFHAWWLNVAIWFLVIGLISQWLVQLLFFGGPP